MVVGLIGSGARSKGLKLLLNGYAKCYSRHKFSIDLR